MGKIKVRTIFYSKVMMKNKHTKVLFPVFFEIVMCFFSREIRLNQHEFKTKIFVSLCLSQNLRIIKS